MKYRATSRLLIGVGFLFLFANLVHAGALERLFAPKAKAWGFWDEHTVSTLKIDHTAWNQLLGEYVYSEQDGIHRIDYANVTQTDRRILEDYIRHLEQTQVRQYSLDEQLAYWVNLYNAATVNIILEHYPVESILDINISPGLFKKGPWGKKILRIEEQGVSLNDIEHRILRPLWKDARIHYALNCASLGCPNLPKIAFTAENSEQLLNRAASEFINHPRGASIDDGQLTVSSIYNWFQSDFGGSKKSVIQHLLKYGSTDLASQLKDIKRISNDRYDWGLNDLKSPLLSTEEN